MKRFNSRYMNSVYPSLGKYFDDMYQLAEAGCMGRTRLFEVLYDRKEFTAAEKLAIANAIVTRIQAGECRVDNKDKEVRRAMEARKDFDRIYRVKKNKAA